MFFPWVPYFFSPHRLFHSQVVSDGNIMLTDEEVDKLEVLCMIRGFVKFGRKYYSHRLNEPFGRFGTVRTVKSNVELDAVNTESDIDSCWETHFEMLVKGGGDGVGQYFSSTE